MTLNSIFLTPNPFTYRSYFLLDKRFGKVISERERGKKKSFTSQGSVRIAKTCDRGLEKAALGPRPRAAFSRPWLQFFAIRTSQLANFIYVFVERCF